MSSRAWDGAPRRRARSPNHVWRSVARRGRPLECQPFPPLLLIIRNRVVPLCGACAPAAGLWISIPFRTQQPTAQQRNNPRFRFPPRAPLSGGSAGCWAFQTGCTGAPLVGAFSAGPLRSPPAVPAAASAVDCGAGVPPARGLGWRGESGPMDRYAGRRPTPQERFPPRAPLSRWLRWLFGVTESGSESLSGSESNQINELRPCRRSSLDAATQSARPRPRRTSWWESIPMPIAIPTPRRKEAEQELVADAPKGAPLKHGVGLFKPGSPARHSSRGRRGRIGS